MSERDQVVCGKHGSTPVTFACRHVARGVACGFHASAEDPDDPWPDAWCDRCEDALQAAGGQWDADTEGAADIQLLCTHCYEAARARNQQPPLLARGADTRLSVDEQAALLERACQQTQETQDASDLHLRWLTRARWDFDADARTLTFTSPGLASLVADVRHVGSYSTKTETFQWAWATFEPDAAEADASMRLREFGEVRGIAELTTANRPCEEADAWEMTSLAAYLLGADSVYRAPFDHLYWFMLLSNWRTGDN